MGQAHDNADLCIGLNAVRAEAVTRGALARIAHRAGDVAAAQTEEQVEVLLAGKIDQRLKVRHEW